MDDARRARRVWLALGTIYVIWGSTYLGIRVGIETIPPFLMVALRFLVAGGLMLAWTMRRGGGGADPIGWRQWRAAGLIGGLLLVGGNGGLAWAEQRVPSGVAALVIATVPIWMALLVSWRKEERIRAATAAGIVVGFGGTALLVLAGGSHGRGFSVPGMLTLVGSAVCWATGSVLSRRAALPKRPLVATGMEMLSAGVMLTILGAATGEFSRLHPGRVSVASLLGVAYLVVFGSIFGFTAYVWLLRNAPMPLVSTYAYVNPVIAVLLGWAILSEPIGPGTVAAAALIVGSVALIVLAPGSRRAAAPAGARGAAGAEAAPPGWPAGELAQRSPSTSK